MLKKSLIGALAVFMSAGLLSACAEEKTEEPQMAVNEMPGPAMGQWHRWILMSKTARMKP